MKSNKEMIKDFQLSWSKNKYWVMSRSQKSYNQIRIMAKNNRWTEEKQQQYELILKELELIQPTEKTLRVTYQHIWGYFKKQGDLKEKEVYGNLIIKKNLDDGQLEVFLKELTTKYEQTYLLKIRWPLFN